MRIDYSPLSPIFRSPLQARILALVLLPDTGEWTITDIARTLDAPVASVHREVARLAENGIFTDRRVGKSRVVGANRGNPQVAPLTQLITVTFGPQVIVAQEFCGLGAESVMIFGSWAARYHGVPGQAPADVDVLVVGDVPQLDAYAAAERAERRLGMPVNPVVRSREAWSEPGSDPLLSDISRKPTVALRCEA